MRATPTSVGLTGLPSWFWIEGYAGQPLTASTHIHLDGLPNRQAGCPSGPPADMDVAVQATPIDYSWRFGDALSTSSTDAASLGVPYPQKDGAITHQFEVTSSASGHPDGYTITTVAHFSVRYAADGGGWQPLTETDRQASLTYKVQQVYPAIVR